MAGVICGKNKMKQTNLFSLEECNECDGTGVAYMWSRSLGPGLKYTIPIHCSCKTGWERFKEYNWGKPKTANQQLHPMTG